MFSIRSSRWVSMLAAGAAFALLLPAAAREIVVPDQAPTIQAAIDQAAGGDVVLVREGIYRENLVISMKPIEIRSLGCPQRTIIDGSRRGSAVWIRHPGAKIDGFTIQAGLADFGGGIRAGDDPGRPVDALLSRLIIQGNEARQRGGGIAVISPAATPVHLVLENVLLHKNLAESGGGIHLFAAPPGIEPPGVVIARIANCTLTENRAKMSGAGLARLGDVFAEIPQPGLPIAFNGIFWRNQLQSGTYQDLSEIEPGMVQFSDIGDGQFNGQFGNFAEDPLFVNPAGGDYRLTHGSPCIDAGVPGVGPLLAPERDFDGAPRYDAPDIPNRNGGFHEMGIDEDSASFIRGDADGNMAIEITDAIYTFDYLFQTVKPRPCLAAMDSNDDGILDLSDGIYSLVFQFMGGAEFPAPYPYPNLDIDRTGTPLPCRTYPNCWP